MTPACMHCGEIFEQHVVRNNDRWCRDGQHTFNCEFHINPELIAFLQAHPETPIEELTKLWINRETRSP